jgi:hypothetical protein
MHSHVDWHHQKWIEVMDVIRVVAMQKQTA